MGTTTISWCDYTWNIKPLHYVMFTPVLIRGF